MANESPEVRLGRENMLHPSSIPAEPGGTDTERILRNIQRLLDSRLADDASKSALEKRVGELRKALEETLTGDRTLRMEKLKSGIKRDRLRARVLELKRERLNKEAEIASRKVSITELKKETNRDHQSEVVMLEERIEALKSDVDAFSETLMLHRRDRERVLEKLVKSNSLLQDKLTERMLWKIVAIDNESEEEAAGRKGISGVTAELLGRLLVLEKEECQICSLLNCLNRASGRESANQ